MTPSRVVASADELPGLAEIEVHAAHGRALVRSFPMRERPFLQKTLVVVPIVLGSFLLGACTMPTATRAHSAQEEANKQTVIAFYEAGLNEKDFDAASRYFGPYYKQHNPNAADGVEGFRTFVAYLKEKIPTSHSAIKSALVDGDYVILHVLKTTGTEDRGTAIVDIFRLENGKIVEHWDVSQAVPERTASGNAMF